MMVKDSTSLPMPHHGSTHSSHSDVEAASQVLALLNQQIASRRAELIALRRDLSAARLELRQTPALQLLEENRRLALAVKSAEARAAAAIRNLVERARHGERDALTGTPNRTLMLDRIGRAITFAKRRRTRLSVLFADLDGFKQINDTYGHGVGDEALCLASRRLQSVVRDSDTVSRHGGDEFLILLGTLSEPADAAVISSKLLASLSQPVKVQAHSFRLSASIGIAIYPEDGKDAAALIGAADVAMFRAKRRGPGRFEFHRPDFYPG
jgi:diguanylate cyclase